MKTLFRYIVVVAIFLMLAILMPQCLKMMFGTAHHTPVVAYSPLLNELAVLDYRQKGSPVTLRNGRNLTIAEFDSLFPLLNFRQLMVDGHLPDSINGHESNMRTISTSQFYTTIYSDTKSHHPSGLHLMYESMPRRVNSAPPSDVFSLTDRATFINSETRQEDVAKGQRFTEALQKAGFQFPCLDSWGDDSPRKRYDEGFMCVDADSSLFHLKMVNGRPFCRKLDLPEGARPVCVPQCFPTDKSFYGFVFTSDHRLFMVSAGQEGGYAIDRFDVPPIDVRHSTVRINADLLSWVILASGPNGTTVTALDRETLQVLDTLTMPPFAHTSSEAFAETLMPIYIKGNITSNGTVVPTLSAGPAKAWWASFAMGLIFLGVCGRKLGKWGWIESLWVALTGLSGLLALLCVPRN